MRSDIDARKLAVKGYGAALDSIRETQQKLVMVKLLRAEFGDKALVPSELLSSMKGALTDAKDRMKRYEETLRASLEVNYKLVLALEEVFADEEAAELTAMAEYFRGRMQRGE